MAEEFIHLVSSESNDVCEKESRKTISPDHVLTALKVRKMPLSSGEEAH